MEPRQVELKSTFKRNMILFGVVFALLGVSGLALYVTTRPYSNGFRDGVLQAFREKGTFRKSHEGDLALAGSLRSQSVGNVWHFSVTDKAVAKELEGVPPGQFIRAHYKEFLYNVGTETNYIVWKVDVIKGPAP